MPKWFNQASLAVLKRFGFRLRMFSYHDSPVYYIEGGMPNGPVMVVWPGFGDNMFSWTRFAIRYGRRFRVLVLDFPGYTGLSPRPEKLREPLTFAQQDEVARNFLADICPQRVDFLVGNSMGGWLGLRAASRHPERIGHLIAINPAGIFTDDEDMARVREIYKIGSYVDYVRMMRHLWNRVPLYIYPFSLTGFYQFMRQPDPGVLLDSISREHFVNEELAKMKVPVSVIWGMKDKLIQEIVGRTIAQNAPGARFYPIEKAGHMPQLERPAELYATIDQITESGTATRP